MKKILFLISVCLLLAAPVGRSGRSAPTTRRSPGTACACARRRARTPSSSSRWTRGPGLRSSTGRGYSRRSGAIPAYWYYITFGDRSGFVFGHFLTIDAGDARRFEPAIDPAGPKLPYEDWGACPFECCTYRDWSVTKDTPIRADRLATSPVVFTAKAGEWVTGTTGVVITTVPGRGEIRSPMPLGNRPAAVGDIVEYLTYQGEGTYRAWFKGQLLDSVEGYEPIVMTVEPVWTWWVKIRNSKGQIGWTDETGNFGHMDGCGE